MNTIAFQEEVIDRAGGNKTDTDINKMLNEEINYTDWDILLKTAIMGLLFYILTNNVTVYYLKKHLLGNNGSHGIVLVQTLLFTIIYYGIQLAN